MSQKSLDEVTKELKKTLSKKRFQHSLSVARLAKELGRRHGWDKSQAYRAGLFHDCAKEWSPRRLVAYAVRHKLKVPHFHWIRKTSPNILHGFVGAHWARRKGWVKEPALAKAIAAHTVGAATMSLESKILYVADLASYDRKFKDAKRVRKIARRNLKEGFREAVSVKVAAQIRKKKPIHPLIQTVWNKAL